MRAAALGVAATAALVWRLHRTKPRRSTSTRRGLITETVAGRDRLTILRQHQEIPVPKPIGARPKICAARWRARRQLSCSSRGPKKQWSMTTISPGPLKIRQADWRSELRAALMAASQFPRHVLDLQSRLEAGTSISNTPIRIYANGSATFAARLISIMPTQSPRHIIAS